jgi:hypothetical protein
LAHIPIPKPSFLDQLEFFGVREGRKVWADSKRKRFYCWDGQHGEIEVFDKRGWHISVIHSITGELLEKSPEEGRRLKL